MLWKNIYKKIDGEVIQEEMEGEGDDEEGLYVPNFE